MLGAALASLLLGTLACGVGETAYEDFVNIDSEGLPATATWADHVQPRLNYYCTGCHDPDSSAGALANLDLTNQQAACGLRGLIVDVIVDQSMPPGDMQKMSPRDLAIFVRWAESNDAECPK